MIDTTPMIDRFDKHHPARKATSIAAVVIQSSLNKASFVSILNKMTRSMSISIFRVLATVPRLRKRLFHWLPELHDAKPALVEALDQTTSFEAWDRLRNDQRLSRHRAQAAMEYATRVLVQELEKQK